MKVLAIGATGFIGSRVAKLLSRRGHEVVVVHRGKTSAENLDVRELLVDRSELLDLRSELVSFGPDVVLDVMPYTENHARTLVAAIPGSTTRIVAISSADVYRQYAAFLGHIVAPIDPRPLTEEAELRTRLYPYRGLDLPFEWADDYDKVLVERAFYKHSAPPVTVLRLPAVYGAGDKLHRLRLYLQRMFDRRPAILLPIEQASWQWTRGYLENVAEAIALAVTDTRSGGRIYNLGDEPPQTERQWIQAIADAAMWDGEIVEMPMNRLPAHLQQPYDFRYHLAVDTSRIRRELNYAEVVDRRDALAETIEWERAHDAGSMREEYDAEDVALMRKDAV